MIATVHRAETITPGELIGRPGALVIDCICGKELESRADPGEGERDVVDRVLAAHAIEIGAGW